MEIIGYRGARLHGVEFGGSGPSILLLHGLMGNAETWRETASWLTDHGRVVAFDARGHGRSDKPNGPYDRAARVGDAAAAIEQLGLGPTIVIGHSMGGTTAWQLAIDRPELVRAIVLGDSNTDKSDSLAAWRDWFAAWPVPFADDDAIRAYFGTDGDFFTQVMVDGRPPFRAEHLLALVADWNARDLTDDLAAVGVPSLVVKGQTSEYAATALQRMAARLPRGQYAEVPDAGHVLHFDNPAGWRVVVETFVREQR